MHQKSRTTNSIINITVSLGAQVLLTLLQFAYRTVFIKTLGTPYLGINGLFTNILTMLSLTELGLDTAITYKLYKPLAERDTNRLQVLMKFYKYCYLVIGCIILVIGFCLIPALPLLIKDYGSLSALRINPILLYLLNLFQTATSYLFFASKSAILKADQKIYISTIVEFFTNVVLLVTQIVTLYMFGNFVLNTTLGLGAIIVSNTIIAIIAIRKYPAVFAPTKNKLELAEIKEIFKDVGALFVYRVNSVVLKATDNIVLSAFIGISTVGLYSNYLMFYTTINTIFDKILNGVKASLGNLFATETVEKQYRLFKVMNYTSFILFGTACVGIGVCANELISVWLGDEFIIPNPFSALIGIEVLFHGIKLNLGQVRNISGVFRQMWYRPIIGVIINLGVSIAFVQVYGIYGVIIGTICADVLANYLMDPRIIYKYSFKDYESVFRYYAINTKYFGLLVISYLLNAFVFNNLFVGHGWLSVGLHILICGITTPFLFCFTCYKSQENRYVMSMVNGVLHRMSRKNNRI